MKRALKGELALIPAAKRLLDEVMSPALPILDQADGGPRGAEARAVDAFKKVTPPRMGAAMQRFGAELQDEQEVLLWMADLAIDTYAARAPSFERRRRLVHRRRAARGRRAHVRQRRLSPHRDDRSAVAGGHRRGRRAEDEPRRVAPFAEDGARRYRRPAPPIGRRHGPARRLRVWGAGNHATLAATAAGR